jgi:hypothetical protein
MVIFTTPLG